MSESSGDTPDWLRQHKETPSKIFLASSSSSEDEDDLPLMRWVRSGAAAGTAAAATGDGPAAGPGPSQAPDAGQQSAAVTVAGHERPEGKAHEPGQHAPAHPTAAAQSQGQGTIPGSSQQPPPPPRGRGRPPKQQAPQVPLSQSQLESQPASQPQSQPQGAAPPAAAAGVTAGVSGPLPIMLPEKLNRNKVLMELPPPPPGSDGHGHGAADLSGDAGAVGRIIVLGGAKGKEAAAGGSEVSLQVDLKGVVYNAWVLPLAGSALVLHIGPTEAKVESLFNDFIRLKEAPDQFGGEQDGGGELAYLLDGEEEAGYLSGDGGEGEEAPSTKPAKGAKKARGEKKPKGEKRTKKAGAGAGKGDKPPRKNKAGAGAVGRPLGVKGSGVSKRSGSGAKAGPGGRGGAKTGRKGRGGSTAA